VVCPFESATRTLIFALLGLILRQTLVKLIAETRIIRKSVVASLSLPPTPMTSPRVRQEMQLWQEETGWSLFLTASKRLVEPWNYFALIDKSGRKANTAFCDYCFSHTIWAGDLNYRIGLNEEQVKNHLKTNDYEALLKHDQVTR